MNAAWEIVEAVFFEQWLRFYFIEEKGEDFYWHMDDPEALREAWPQFAAIISLDGNQVEHQASLRAIYETLHERENGPALLKTAEACLAEPAFLAELAAFPAWVATHERELESGSGDFTAWLQAFAATRAATLEKTAGTVGKTVGETTGEITAKPASGPVARPASGPETGNSALDAYKARLAALACNKNSFE